MCTGPLCRMVAVDTRRKLQPTHGNQVLRMIGDPRPADRRAPECACSRGRGPRLELRAGSQTAEAAGARQRACWPDDSATRLFDGWVQAAADRPCAGQPGVAQSASATWRAVSSQCWRMPCWRPAASLPGPAHARPLRAPGFLQEHGSPRPRGAWGTRYDFMLALPAALAAEVPEARWSQLRGEGETARARRWPRPSTQSSTPRGGDISGAASWPPTCGSG